MVTNSLLLNFLFNKKDQMIQDAFWTNLPHFINVIFSFLLRLFEAVNIKKHTN